MAQQTKEMKKVLVVVDMQIFSPVPWEMKSVKKQYPL